MAYGRVTRHKRADVYFFDRAGRKALRRDIVARSRRGKPILDVWYLIIDKKLEQRIGMDRVTIREPLFLDIAPDGRLEAGPNKDVWLGRLRQAVG